MDRNEIIQSRCAENIADVMADGPALRYRPTWVIAKDTPNTALLVGGLGCMGVGRMWVNGQHFWDIYADDPTFADAPERTSAV